jgi:hypothetical protein
MNNENLKQFLPGFTMGITRACISHPFEILKMNSQLNIKNKFNLSLFRGIHYSIITNGLERGVQFYMFEHFKKKYGSDNKLLSSISASIFSTSFTFPYNVILLKKTVLNQKIRNVNLYKSSSLEFCRNFMGSTIFLYVYDNTKDKFPISASAIIATTCVWTVTYPLDTVKNVLISNTKKKFNLCNLYRGIHYPILRSFPSSIVGMYIYEKMKKWLNNNQYN